MHEAFDEEQSLAGAAERQGPAVEEMMHAVDSMHSRPDEERWRVAFGGRDRRDGVRRLAQPTA